MMVVRQILMLGFLAGLSSIAIAQKSVIRIPVADGWAKNSVNTVVFRKNSLVTLRDTQFIAFYDSAQHIVLGKRKTGSKNWKLQTSAYTGDATDAHRSISMMVDGDGYLHIAWDHHGNALNYSKGRSPGSLWLGEKLSMTGKKELKVTYPEFYKLPDGGLLFLYRDGSSGNGNLMLNRYDLKTKQWMQVRDGLINGEGKRNAYWQMTIDLKGTIHLSWVWRESSDVASNHDMCYAKSADGGITWQKSSGEVYNLPITASTAEYACIIPQKSELINQTSMATDASNNPWIASYWKTPGSDIPQYRIIYFDGKQWNTGQVSNRKTTFSLSGSGTKRIPIARPQLVISGKGKRQTAVLIFRDEERGSKVSVARSKNSGKGKWKIFDLTEESVGSWEPSFDTELWKTRGILNIFVQQNEQADAEGIRNIPAKPVSVLEWKP